MHRTHISSSRNPAVQNRTSALRHACSVALTVLLLTAAAHPQQPLTVGQRLAQDLTWTQPEREARFAHMDRLFPTNRIHHGRPRFLPNGEPIDPHLPNGETVDQFMQRDRFAGILVLQNGRIRLEKYALGTTPRTTWTTFSVSKAVTSTLVGYALAQGKIDTLDDPVTRYIPELSGSTYSGVTIRQLLTMTSGVHWVEDYTAPDSDNVRLYSTPPSPGAANDTVVDYMRRLPREAEPGTRWVYKTGETDLTGVLVRRATGMSLSAFLQQTLWPAIGAESNATWIAETGKEFGGSGLSATLRDLARLGDFIRTERTAPTPFGSYLAQATRTEVQIPNSPNQAYGYQWWTYPDGSFAALGIFGQSILIDPARNLTIVMQGAWPQATGPALTADRNQLWQAIRTAADQPTPKAPRPTPRTKRRATPR